MVVKQGQGCQKLLLWVPLLGIVLLVGACCVPVPASSGSLSSPSSSPQPSACSHCGGRGSLSYWTVCNHCQGYRFVTCSHCSGTGRCPDPKVHFWWVRCQQCQGKGYLADRLKCLRCWGRGKTLEVAVGCLTCDMDPQCRDCQGTGRLYCSNCGGGGVMLSTYPCPLCQQR